MSATEQVKVFETAVIEDTSFGAFYRDMNTQERRTFWACAAGWALDGMDFMIYPLVIGTIIAIWKVDPGYAGLAGTVTLLSSAIGGWLGGYIADRIGRVRTLQFTILWFSFFSWSARSYKVSISCSSRGPCSGSASEGNGRPARC